MADNKRQHYVPRCYFKPFSVDGVGNAINLFNISRCRCLQNAPLRGQCAKDYLYGEDLTIERALQRFEGEYARILRVLQSAQRVNENDLNELRRFAYLQYSRTDMAFRRARECHESLFKEMLEGRPELSLDVDFSDRAIMLESMKIYTETYRVVEDLKTCIILNRTDIEFITSDDPSVFTNRYFLQRLKNDNFGLQSAGALLILPLTTRLLLMCYDGDVYTIPEKDGYQVSIRNPADAHALNEHQYLNAANNLYFLRWSDRDRVDREFAARSLYRPESRLGISVLVPMKKNEKGKKRYRQAIGGEKRTAQERLVVVSTRHPAPSLWLSKLKFRSQPKTYSNGSAVGEIRKTAWMTLLAEKQPIHEFDLQNPASTHR